MTKPSVQGRGTPRHRRLGVVNVATNSNSDVYYEIKKQYGYPYALRITSAVTSLNSIFYQASGMKVSPPIYGPTSQVTSMRYMFAQSQIESIPPMDTSAVTDWYSAFSGTYITAVPALNYNAMTTGTALLGQTRIVNVPAGALNFPNATNLDSLFSSCSYLNSVGDQSWPKVTSLSGAFGYGGPVSIGYLDAPLCTNWGSMFYNNGTRLTTVTKFNSLAGTDFSGMFYNCTGLTSMPSDAFTSTANGTNFSTMFRFCSNLTNAPAMDTSKGTNFSSMFDGCSKLTAVPTGFSTALATNIDYMFNNCSALTSIPALNCSNVTTAPSSFAYCTNVTSIGITGIRVSFSIQGCKLQAAALNTLFTNLGLANAGATVTITSNPGAATCDRSIATAKGWTVVG